MSAEDAGDKAQGHAGNRGGSTVVNENAYQARFSLEALRDKLEEKQFPGYKGPLYANTRDLLALIEALFVILDDVEGLRSHWHTENYLGDREVHW